MDRNVKIIDVMVAIPMGQRVESSLPKKKRTVK